MFDPPQVPDPGISWPRGHAPTAAVVFAHNAVDVNAPAQKVWALLTDCEAWPRWYRHCSDVSILRGGPGLQAQGKFRFKTLGRFFEPEVVTFQPNRQLIWSAKGPARTSGSHAWLIEETRKGCRLITEEAQTGLALMLVAGRIRAQLLTAHEDWVRSLKVLAES